MAEEPKSKGWWKTVPGILSAIAGIITAVTGLLVALHQIGAFDVQRVVPSTPPDKTTVEEPPVKRTLKTDTSEEVSPELIRRSVKPRAERSLEPVDKLPDGRVRHLYSVWIEAPPQIMNKIAKVLYHYDHSAFSTPRTESSNPQDGFRDSYRGIGAVNADMDIILVLHDERQVTLKFNMYGAIFGR